MRKIIVNCAGRETRIAILEDGRLAELYIERPVDRRVVGNIYKGKVENVLPGMQAAFVDIGTDKNAFLYVDDCLPPGDISTEKKRDIREVLTKGQEIFVQVSKEPVGTKGARVTTQLSLPGRFVVFMPNVRYVGVSRRIKNEKERERLRTIAFTTLGTEEGVIIRTLAEGVGKKEIEDDILFLRAQWQRAWETGKHKKPPAVIYQEIDLVSRVVRDMLSEEVDEFIIDSRSHYAEVRDLLSHDSRELKEKVRLYTGKEDIFSYYAVEGEMERALKRKVWLKHGGYLVIDQTEAMTVIDVNTGKYVGQSELGDTVVKTNLEACAEIARQLRLRDVGGIIIVDFIDMAKEEHRKSVQACMEAELRKDRTKTHLLGFTQLGLLEMTRKKVRQNLGEVLTRPCPTCGGTGRILSEASVIGRMERELREYSRGSHAEAVLLEAHPHILDHYKQNKKEPLRQLEKELGLAIYLKDNECMSEQHYRIAFTGTEEEVLRRAQEVHAQN
ncbi:Rne/Rng family ribonuclease [Aneurinibacillus terranovensis]|uniref:Rne/Rng family ribonuclease n=1 Tax=Aneurinibacillus terranovensis TaxID=278991 RepID=UPI00040B3E5A|nr:Rne/Rng family ribonuclease [Aneurinibacillus terranovensis]